MHKRPISERLFEELCSDAGVSCTPIAPGAGRTPDFEVRLAGARLVCEIKQIDPNHEDREDLEALNEGEAVGRYVPNRLRQKLKNVSTQLKAAVAHGCPTLLVVYDNTPFKMYVDHRDVVQALFGHHSIAVFPPGPNETRPQISEPFFGRNRGLTIAQNTSVSALAIMDGGPTGAVSLRVYHNPYAAVILRPELLAAFPVVQPLLPGAATVNL